MKAGIRNVAQQTGSSLKRQLTVVGLYVYVKYTYLNKAE